MILTHEIVAGSVISVTKILVIEDQKLDITFIHITFGSHSLLEPTGDQTGSNSN
jgi:hypothetical protein